MRRTENTYFVAVVVLLSCCVVVWLCGFVAASKATFDLCMICCWIGFR